MAAGLSRFASCLGSVGGLSAADAGPRAAAPPFGGRAGGTGFGGVPSIQDA